MNLVRFLHPHRRGLFVLLALALALGARAALISARSIYPRVAFPRISVIAERGEAPVRGMLIEVTKPIEQSVSAVPDLIRVRSKTVRGASELSLDFKPETDMREALSLVRARVAQAGLPADVGLTIERQTPAVFPVMSFNVIPAEGSTPVARARVAEWVELDLKPRLMRLPDAFMATVQSGDLREYVFEADPVKLAQAGVTLADVKDALEKTNVQRAVGRSEAEGLQYQLLVDARIMDRDAIVATEIRREQAAPVALRDLGLLVETTAERTMVVTGGGKDGVVVSVFLRDGGKVTDLSKGVEEIIAQARPQTPHGAAIVPVYDQATLVNDSIDGVRDAIGLGAALSIVVLLIFLGNWRVTLVAGLAIPISVVLTFALFPLTGESLNLMSLGGLAVAIGLIIDDAIVVVENVARRLEGYRPAGKRALIATVAGATQEVFGAIVGSSLTTVVVFLPLVLLEGVVGQFFRSLAFALGMSIIASLVVSLVYSPLMLLLPGLAPRRGMGARRWMTWIQDRYAGLLAVMLRHPRVAALVLVGVAIAGASGVRGVPIGFLPEMDEGGFVLDYSLPVGSSLDETDAACRRIEKILLETPEVASLSRRTGAELGFFATEQFTGDMLVGLAPRRARGRSVFAVIEGLRERMAEEVPQAETEFIQVMQDTINDLAGNTDPIEVKFLGSDYPALQRAADEAATALESVHGIVDVKNHVSFGSPELTWRVDSGRAARHGFAADTIADQARAQLLGEVATRIQEGDRFVDVRVRHAEAWRARSQVESPGPSVFLETPAGRGRTRVPISEVADFARSLNENELERENQLPMVRVTAAIQGRDLGSASRAVEAAVGALPHDPGVRVEFGGQSESARTAFTNMIAVFGLGAGMVFLLLVVQFRSLRLPIVMFMALPFGQLGGLYALRFAHIPLNISSGMGLIMLVGLVVKNGIIMIEYAQHLCRTGKAPLDSVIEAARVRLRPILMTTLAAIAGLVPLAMGLGSGSELQKPLAVAVIGGLVVSTLFTLVVVPLGCVAFAGSSLRGEEDDEA